MPPFLLFVLVAVVIGDDSIEVIVSSTVGGRRMHRIKDIEWSKGPCDAHPGTPGGCVMVDPGSKHQTIDGFGGSFLRSGAFTLNTLPVAAQDDVLRALFDPNLGAGLSVGKVPIGACDYCPLRGANATSWWSYREHESEPFDLGPDLVAPGGTVPYIRRAAEISGNRLWLQSTMDYAPRWMQQGSLPKSSINPKYYGALAQYYLDYATHFKEHAGFPLRYISLFNEPHDSYTWIPMDDIATLLVEHVGPLFRSAGHDAPMLTYASQSSRNLTWYRTPAVLKRPGVLKYTDVLMYHGYDCNPWTCTGLNNTCPDLNDPIDLIDRLHKEYPQIRMWMTEVCYAQEYGSFSPPPKCPRLPLYDFEDGLQWGKMIIADMRVGASAWIYWNIILNQNGGPHMTNDAHNDPKVDIQHPLVIVNTETNVVTYTGAYWFLAHFGRYAVRGSVRIGSTGSPGLSVNVYHVAFYDRATSKIIVNIVNDSPVSTAISLDYGGARHTSLVLDPISITTLRYSAKI